MQLNKKANIIGVFILTGFLISQSSVSVFYEDIDNQIPVTDQSWELYHQVSGEWVYVSSNLVGNQNPVNVITNDLYRIKVLKDIDGVNKHMLYWEENVNNLSLFMEFSAILGSQTYTANYKSKVSIQINLPTEADIYLHDPWLVDEFDELYGSEHIELQSNLCDNGICDVFLEQGFEVEEWRYPYYKIVAKRLLLAPGSLAESISGHIYRLYELVSRHTCNVVR